MKNENMIVDTQIGETVWGMVGNLYTSAKSCGYKLLEGDVVTLDNRGYGDRFVVGFATADGVSFERVY